MMGIAEGYRCLQVQAVTLERGDGDGNASIST